MASEDSEVSISANLSNNHIQKLLEDKSKARNYIKSCKNIIKRQVEQLKKQQAEFKNAVSTLETQSFTTRFHSVAFKLELDIMRLINIRRRIDTIAKKKFFLKFVGQVLKSRFSEYAKIRTAYALVRQAGESLAKYIKNKQKQRMKLALTSIEIFSAGKDPNSAFSRLEILKKENFGLKAALLETGKGGTFEELVEENKKLKEKLKSTEQSVGNFIRDMGCLLNSHEPPGFAHENDSPKPATKAKKGKKPKSRVPVISPDRVEFPVRKNKINRVNFD
jgi:inorganic triphosphatase YgiF